MVNIDVKDETNAQIETVQKQLDFPATKKYIVGVAVEKLDEELIGDTEVDLTEVQDQ